MAPEQLPFDKLDRQISQVPLSEEAQRLYMNYALSVIMGRALPDVRDGLKPVQRRILFAMHHELHVGPDGKPAKCARIVGDVIGKYHPHGDSAVYEALVRLAQDWVMRAPLIQGQGNFGSLDGDSAAAYRYTEAKLSKIATELLVELPKKTVGYRPSFDGTRFEPVVLPARFPNLLVNGSQGIAVGMATSIPPHNLGEVVDALVTMVEDPDIALTALLKKVKGPDFPTGAEIVTSKAELKQIYETGQGTLKVRGEWKLEEQRGQKRIILTSIPWGLEKHALVEKIADVIISKKLPPLVDVRDESTEQVRIVLEIKRDANPDLVIAYLQKHTPLQSNVQINLTCLVPSDNPMARSASGAPRGTGPRAASAASAGHAAGGLDTEWEDAVPTPERLDLKRLLKHFLDFRYQVVEKRLSHELAEIEKRLHVLEGFEKVFDALDEIIKIIRSSEGKADAAAKIMKKFGLDDEQTDAILELKLYRLAKLEILVIQQEATKKRAEQKRIQTLLKSQAKLWGVVKDELIEIRGQYAEKRRTKILTGAEEQEFTAEDFIIEEDAVVIATAQGWVKRQGTVKDLASTRIKDGDRVLACVAGSTRASVAFFSSFGSCYVARIADIPASTGYGDPIQKLFKFADGEKLVAAFSFDARVFPGAEEAFGVAATRQGLALRFPLAPHKDPSTRAGRKFAKLKDGDEVVSLFTAGKDEKGWVVAATTDGHGIAVGLDDVALLSGPGRGTQLIKLGAKAEVLGAKLARSKKGDVLVASTTKGKKYELSVGEVASTRGGRGKLLVKTSGFAHIESEPPSVPNLADKPQAE